MSQAIFAKKFAKNYAIMVNVNKKVVLCPFELVYLYDVHKTTDGFL